MNNLIKVNDIVRVTVGKNNSVIAYDAYGKVVLFKNNVCTGWVKITSVKEKEKYYIVTGENVYGYDFYKEYEEEGADNIKSCDYEEFKQVVVNNGYTIGFEYPFKYEMYVGLANEVAIYPPTEEMQIFAYNIKTGVVIVGETWNNKKTFNSIKVTVPNVSCFEYCRPYGFSSGSVNYITLDLCTSSRCTLKNLNYVISNQKSNIWGSNLSPYLWNYSDRSDDSKCNLWNKTIDRILLAPKEVELFLGNCERLKPIFSKRKQS